jgi:hypothetical protein
LEWEFGVLKDSACKTREVMLASIAAKTTISTSCAMVFATMGAHNVITPTCFDKSILANFLVMEVVDD